MNKHLNKYSALYCILTAMIFICGCGNSTEGSRNASEIKQEEITYVSQPINLPDYESFDGAYSDGSDLYYAASPSDQSSQQYQTAFYVLKQGAAEPEMKFPAESQSVLNMTMDEAGNIYYLGYESPDREGSSQAVPSFTLHKADQQGVPLLNLNLSEYTNGQEQVMIQNLAVDGENRIMLFSSDQKIFVLDPTGQLLFETRADGMIMAVSSSGGKVFVALSGLDGIELREVDVSGKKLSAQSAHNITSGNRLYMAPISEGKLLLATESSVYQYNPESAETIKKFDWQTYDVAGIAAGILLPYGENGVLIISRDYGTVPMKTECTAFREAAEGEVVTPVEKIQLTLGAFIGIAQPIRAEVVNFNKANPDVKIEIKIYADGKDTVEKEDLNRFYSEVMAGNGPDLMITTFDVIDQLAARGALEDLNTYFEKDESLNRSDFFENILEAFETEEHLYGMPLGFNIYTIIGRTSVLGEEPGWNPEELMAFVKEHPEGKDIFVDTSKSGVFRLLKRGFTSQLLNTDQTDNYLDRELLVKMLEFANQYENDDRYTYEGNLAEKIKGGQVVLLDTEVQGGWAYFCFESMFDEPVTFMGYPTATGNGNLIYSRRNFAITSSSEHKDIAWKFLSGLLTEEGQIRLEDDFSMKGLRIRKDVLEYHFAWSKGYWPADFGVPHFIHERTNDPVAYRALGEVPEEAFEPIRNLIQSVDTAVRSSPELDQMIEEEASFYFNGTKSVEEVVDIIENRVRTYVNENK